MLQIKLSCPFIASIAYFPNLWLYFKESMISLLSVVYTLFAIILYN